MAVALYGTVTVGESASSSSLSFSHEVGAGSNRMLGAGVSVYNVFTTGVTFNTTETLTKIVEVQRASGDAVSLYRLVAPTETTANVVTTFSVAEEVVVGALNFSGVDQATPVSDSSTASVFAAAISATVTSAVDDLCWDVYAVFNKVAGVDGGQTQRYREDNVGAFISGGGSTEPGAASVTMGWTWTGNTNAVLAVAAIAAVAATAGPKGPLGHPLHGALGGPI